MSSKASEKPLTFTLTLKPFVHRRVAAIAARAKTHGWSDMRLMREINLALMGAFLFGDVTEE